MFMGEYQHTIDDKGRIIVPSRFREALADGFVITKGLDKCLFIYPRTEWDTLTEQLRQLPFTKSDARAFMRFFFSGATDSLCDSQGRTGIPSSLREYAGLGRDAVVIGVGSRIELWSQKEWDRFQETAEENYEDLAEKLHDLGALI